MADSLLDEINATPRTESPSVGEVAAVRQALGLPATAPTPANPLAAGLRAGVRELGGLTGSAASALGKFSGLEGLEQWGAQTAQEQFAKAQQVGRPDLEVAPWRENGAAFLPWLGYQAAKQVPQIAAGIGAGMLVPQAAVPAALSRAGAALPEILGGGAFRAAEGYAAKKAAVETGQNLARQAVGQEIAGLVPAAGSMYQEAMDRPGGPTRADAAKAFAMAPIYSALDAVSPAVEVSRLSKGLTGNFAKRVTASIATDAILEMPQEAAQTAMELSFRPDLSAKEKSSQIVDAAITGAAVGGVFGGVSGVRGTKNISPARMTLDQLIGAVDNDLNPPSPSPPAGPQPSPTSAAPQESSAPPMMAQIEEAQAPAVAAKEEAAAAKERTAKLYATIADTMEGGAIAQNTRQIKTVLGDVQTLPDAINKFFDIQDRADQRPKDRAGVLTAAQKKIGNALGIVTADGAPMDIDAEIDGLTQRLTAAQTPGERQQITSQIDRLDLLRPVIADVRAARAAPTMSAESVAEPSAVLEPEIAAPAPEVTPTPGPQQLSAEAEDLLAKGGVPFKVTQNLVKIAREHGIDVKGTGGAEAQRIVEQLRAMKDAQTATVATPTAETPSAVQEPSPAGVYVQPTAEIGGAVGEGNTEGREAPAPRVETAPEVGVENIAPTQEIAPTPPVAPAPSKTASTFMQQQGIKQLSPEERIAARERQKAEEQAYLAKRQSQVQKAFAQNAKRGGVTAAPTTSKGMTAQEFLDRRNRERPSMGSLGEESDLDRDVSSLVENGATGKQVLDFLGQNAANEFDRAIAKYLSRLGVTSSVRFADVNDPDLKLDREAAAGRAIYGSYNVEQDRINLYERAGSAQVVLHEFLHSATDKAIRVESPAAKRLKSVFTEFSARADKFSQATPAYDNEAEFVSEAFSNPDFREFLKTQKVGPKNLWEKFKDAVFRLLRLPQRARTVFDQVMEVGEPLFRENQQTSIEDVYRATEGQPLTESPLSIDKTFSSVAKTLDAAVKNIGGKDTVESALRRAALGWNSVTHMQARYGKDLFTSKNVDWIQEYIDHNQMRSSVAAKMSQLFKSVNDGYNALEQSNPTEAKAIRKLMRATEFDLDWRKSFTDHTWLNTAPNRDQLRDLHNDLRREGGRLSASSKKLFDQLEAVNNVMRYSQLSLTLRNMIVSDSKISSRIPGIEVDPMDVYMQRSAMHDDPFAAQEYWRTTLKNQIASTKPFIKEQRAITKDKTSTGLYVRTLKDRKEASRIFEPLDRLIKGTEKTMMEMGQSPNFHLGRFGNYFVTFRLLKNGDVADEAAKLKVARAMNAAGVEAQLSPENTKPLVFVRAETQEQAEYIRQLAVQMRDRGWLDPEHEPLAGQRAESEFYDVMNPQWLQKYIELLSAESGAEAELEGAEAAAAAETRQAMISRARELYLNMLPDNALAKVLTERKGISGYSPDMMRSFAFRHQVGVNAVANLATMQNIANDLTEMRRIVRASMTGPTALTVKRQNIFGEISQRESERSMRPQVSFWDSLRALNNAYFLASPAYVLTNMTQPGVLLWPQLSKEYGYVRAAKALAETTGDAFAVMRAVMSTERSPDAIITEKALEQSKIDADTAEFVMRVAISGNLDLGGVTRELARVVENENAGTFAGAMNRALRWAGAAGYYSETFTRLSAALAARRLYLSEYGNDSPDRLMAYVNKTINESMLNYSTWNTARKMGKMGVAGEYTPVMFSFMTYQAQVFEKMYRELRDAFGGSKEARKFLVAHLSAVTALAGTLGLPFVSIAARVFDALKDEFGDDDEPSDFKSAWRNFLADALGKEMGEVLARGAPRALGFDLSSRTSEADLMPLSRFLTDRRDWRDVAKDSSLRALGSPVSMVLNIIDGADKVAQGNILEGLQEMVPNGLKGPFAAYQMAADGRYVDNQGRELPMTPEARDIIWQALGYSPAEKAEYQEANLAQTVRRGILTREAANLRDQLADAILNQSPDREALTQRALEFDRAHPDRSVLKSVMSTIRRRREGVERARVLGTPVGVQPKDIGALGLTRYMNVDLQ